VRRCTRYTIKGAHDLADTCQRTAHTLPCAARATRGAPLAPWHTSAIQHPTTVPFGLLLEAHARRFARAHRPALTLTQPAIHGATGVITTPARRPPPHTHTCHLTPPHTAGDTPHTRSVSRRRNRAQRNRTSRRSITLDTAQQQQQRQRRPTSRRAARTRHAGRSTWPCPRRPTAP
jgi:hypothetical protein